MFGKLMNNFYYGKSGKGDYRKEDLPHNRWQLFWEMLRVRISGLCRLNLMDAVTWLPAMLVIGMTFFSWLNAAGVAVEAGTAEAAALFQGQQASLLFYGLLLLIPCIAITGPCTAGVAYVTRNWARDEHAFVWSDFKDAVKGNWKQGLCVSAITAVLPFMLYVCWTFYGQMAQQNQLFTILQVLIIMFGAMWYLALTYMYPLMVTYDMKLRVVLRNAFLLAVGRLPMSLGIRLLHTLPCIVAALVVYFFGVNQWVLLVLVLYYVVLGFALSRFVSASYTNAVFDRFINPRIEGAEVNRGLSAEEDEDEEDEDEPQA